MSKVGETFFTSVGCMDGRVQEPIAEFGRAKFNAQFADTITEPGLVGLLVKKPVDEGLLSSIKQKIKISIEKHHSKGIIIHGHQNCAGHPVDDEVHKNDIRKSVKVIQSLLNSALVTVGVFVKRSSGWVVEEL